MRAVALAFALLLSAPLLTLAAVDITESQYPAGSNCDGTATLTGTQSSDACQTSGDNSFKVTCSGLRHGTFDISEYAGTTCAGTSPSATYSGTDSTSCISATLINAQFKIDCLVPCTDAASCNNHGTCNTDTGVCTCTDNYTGDNCMVAPSGGTNGTNACPTGSNQCGDHGACNDAQTACTCTDGYTGDACDVAPTAACPTGSTQCGAHGACNGDQTACACTDGYTGTACDTPPACTTSCGDHGFCNTDSTGCECTDGYTGDTCTEAPVAGDCPTNSTQCGEHGSCNDATTACVCTDGYRGNTCGVPAASSTCNDANCKNGECDGGVCKCNDGWTGSTCETQVADMAIITYYSGNTCDPSTQTDSVDVSLDSCTQLPGNLTYGSVLCPNGVNGAYTLKIYDHSDNSDNSTTTTCTGDLSTLLGTDNTDCRALDGGVGYLTVKCAQSGAMAVQASLLMVALLAFISKLMQ